MRRPEGSVAADGFKAARAERQRGTPSGTGPADPGGRQALRIRGGLQHIPLESNRLER